MNVSAPINTQDSTLVDPRQNSPVLTSQSAKDRKTPEQSILRDKSHSKKDEFYSKDELAEAIGSSFRVNEFFADRFDAFWNALGKHFNDFDIKKTDFPATNGKRIEFDMPALVHAAVHNMKLIQDSPETGALFSSRNGHIQVKNGEIQFVPGADAKKSNTKKTVNKPLTYEDAYNAIIIASMNKEMIHPNTLLIEGGSRADRLMYMRAVKAYNATVPLELRFKTNLAAISLAPITNADKEFRKYMHRETNGAQQNDTGNTLKDADLPTADDWDAFNNGEVPEKTEPEAISSATTSTDKPDQGTPETNVKSAEIIPAAYIQKKGNDIEVFLAENTKNILKQTPIGKTGGFPSRNVYLVNIPEYPNDETSVAKVDGKLTVIYSKDDVIEFRDEHIYRENDTAHEKHPQYRPPATQEIPTPSSVVDLSDFSMAATTFTQPYPNFDKFRETFWGAVTIQPAAPAPAPVQERASKPAGPKPGAGSVG